MGSAFHQLCPRYSGTLTPTAPTAIRLWDTFTFLLLPRICHNMHTNAVHCGPQRFSFLSGKEFSVNLLQNSNYLFSLNNKKVTSETSDF